MADLYVDIKLPLLLIEKKRIPEIIYSFGFKLIYDILE